jgi:hypothetical protein
MAHSLRRTPARSRAVSPSTLFPASPPPRSGVVNEGNGSAVVQRVVPDDEKCSSSDVNIKVIIKRIDHVDTEKQVIGMLCVTRHTSHVTRHTSHVTRHTSHVTRHAGLLCRPVPIPCPVHPPLILISSSSHLVAAGGLERGTWTT